MDPGATPGDDLPSFLAGPEGAGSHDYEQPPAPDIRPAPPFCALYIGSRLLLGGLGGWRGPAPMPPQPLKGTRILFTVFL